MNDNEIIKALECCSTEHCKKQNCPLFERKINTKDCVEQISKNALDLINRQQAEKEALQIELEVTRDNLGDTRAELNSAETEIERLQNLTEKDFEQTAISTVKRHQKWIEYRTIKEFAERLKETANSRMYRKDVVYIVEIDNLVKEMVGEDK